MSRDCICRPPVIYHVIANYTWSLVYALFIIFSKRNVLLFVQLTVKDLPEVPVAAPEEEDELELPEVPTNPPVASNVVDDDVEISDKLPEKRKGTQSSVFRILHSLFSALQSDAGSQKNVLFILSPHLPYRTA